MSAITDSTKDQRPRISSRFRLQWEDVQGAWVLLYPEGMVKLNDSAGEIMKRCDGARDVQQIVADLEQAFDAQGLAGDVSSFLDIATKHLWIEWA
ncbi:pyrroloquinoline quinone biosynthesis peptide chaperone PqqD [Thiomonas sp. FB-Cd]|uniref:pyrroloquinoline quinone biosynthesis peptide chaperone PqqD n=1 Tax=Thiomonas sp. FB-Cd TaxID=1158292 RepID=UPI000691A0DB|nr:pyrroloquinoline quinone biosynthesis peptide chaperone PqqD [Thiomonas sp. FB-Cd]